jgi:GNAT superfamily N-acetyltransferase
LLNHPLDNPVWYAANTGSSKLASGSASVKMFDKDVSPFSCMIEGTVENLLALYEMNTEERTLFLWAHKLLPMPEKWEVLHCIPGIQMVYQSKIVAPYDREGIMPLTAVHIPAMLALTQLTKPGPFGTRTIEFGNYEGIFEGDRLAAMAGHRFYCYDYIEISAVCTHPDHQGKGYARKLLLSQLESVIKLDATPYLHVKSDNDRAIQVYESLGFSKRMDVFFYVITKGTSVVPQSYP